MEARERDGEPVPGADVAARFQEAVVDVLTAKAVRAATEAGIDYLLLGGGVAANSRLRALAAERCERAGHAAAGAASRAVHRQRRDGGRARCSAGRRMAPPPPAELAAIGDADRRVLAITEVLR